MDVLPATAPVVATATECSFSCGADGYADPRGTTHIRAVLAPNVEPFPLLSVARFARTLQLELDRLVAPEPEPLTCPPRLASAPLMP